MIGKKTREQQRRIIEKRVDTTSAGADFDPRPDLKSSDRREARKEDGRPQGRAQPRKPPDDAG